MLVRAVVPGVTTRYVLYGVDVDVDSDADSDSEEAPAPPTDRIEPRMSPKQGNASV